MGWGVAAALFVVLAFLARRLVLVGRAFQKQHAALKKAKAAVGEKRGAAWGVENPLSGAGRRGGAPAVPKGAPAELTGAPE